MWTKNALHDWIRTKLGDHRFVLVSNREPYQHRFAGERIECVPPVSGMVSALEPIMRASGGTWIAHASGTGDRLTVDARGHVRVPPGNPCYTLKRLWLSKEQQAGYYDSLANEGLWPLCHRVFTPPIFNPQHWPIYREVNGLFAETACLEAGRDPTFVFVQDYHFGLVPRMLKNINPNLIVAHFWHIPWPNPEVFQTFPWREELLDGLLGNDLLGFQLRTHCQNFLDSVHCTLEAKVDYEHFEVTRGGKSTLVRPFPISIDFDEHVATAQSNAVEDEMEYWRRQLRLSDQELGIGIDRIDYTKGILERMRAIDRLLKKHPSHRGRLLFVQIGVPSRTHIRKYQDLEDELDTLVDEINWRWSSDCWHPIVLLKEQHSPVQMMALHRLADFCLVSSLDDGMNLVAKEFVASRFDDDGVLILSRFTGAARELNQALLVNPFAEEEMADAVHTALSMAAVERRKRMQKMRAVVAENNIYRWGGKLLSALLKFDFSESVRAESAVLLEVG